MITKDTICDGLRNVGVGRGDIVLLHSALSSLGTVDGGAETVVEAFLDTLGREGTLVVPTFGSLGVITDAVKNRPDAVHSLHPCACVAAIGADAEFLCAEHWKADTAHGADTPYTRIADKDGYVCLLGVDQDRSTLFHTAEALLELPYLTDRKGVAQTPAGPVEKTWRFFPGPHRDFIQWDRALRQNGILCMGQIGNAVVRLIKAREYLAFGLETGKQNPAFALCDNPRCGDCIRQRADLRKARFDAESFRIASSAALAGRYVPEIIESLQASGVFRVELDYVQGIPVHRLSSAVLERHVSEFQESGVEVIGLRSCVGGTPVESLLEQAKALGLARVTAPLQAGGKALLDKAKALKLCVSFYNTHRTGADAAALLGAWKEEGRNPAFTFDPGAFAACGEKPFLQTYKTKVARYMDQLDVCDRAFDGTPTALAAGNAEIKELVSILRCRSFPGYLVLAESNRLTGSLPETAARFLALLDAM